MSSPCITTLDAQTLVHPHFSSIGVQDVGWISIRWRVRITCSICMVYLKECVCVRNFRPYDT